MFLLLLTALLYPGDKIIFQKDQVRPIRQPGGYYSDFKVFSPTLALLSSLDFEETMAKKTNKLSVRPPTPSIFLLPCCCPFSYRSWDADILGVSHCIRSGQEPEKGTLSMLRKLPKKIKKIRFKEFEEFTRKLKAKRPSGPQQTHPNFFWPGHLLDKLQIYLPTVTTDRSLALFSCVQHRPHAYSATYHPNHWWPIKNMNYLTCAYYDAPKVYHIN
ncbi:hypothetical protein PAL_GLEAN10022311 [Pteropus alecto]|uniref:Uncharacterized protein n=1 Tax=Pteropus alecto TaxID=9402 RepID=L5KBN6_PTEAL|nr:hypothetical protein PAL_GLEAN10022311 [Pteropus alecto]